jgi:membrane protein
LSWLIVLYGAEFSFAYQNEDTYEFEPDALLASHRLRIILSLQIAHHLVQTFIRGEKAPTARAISSGLEIPIRFVNDILFNLVRSGILSVTQADESSEKGYQPARDVNSLSIHYIIDALEERGLNEMPFTHAPEFAVLSASLAAFGKTVEGLPDNKLLKEL